MCVPLGQGVVLVLVVGVSAGQRTQVVVADGARLVGVDVLVAALTGEPGGVVGLGEGGRHRAGPQLALGVGVRERA